MDRGRPDREGGKSRYDVRQERTKSKEKGGGAGNSRPTGMNISVTKVQAPFLQKLMADVSQPPVHKKRQLEEMESDEEYDLEHATGTDAASQLEIEKIVARKKAQKVAEEKEKQNCGAEVEPTNMKHTFKLPSLRKRKADKADPASAEKRAKTSQTKEEVKTVKPLKPWGQLKPNDVIITRVKNITHFGLFADVGGIDGLLHNEEMLPRPPGTVRRVGDVIEVRVVEIAVEGDSTWTKGGGKGRGTEKTVKETKKTRICLSEKPSALQQKKKAPKLLSFDDDDEEEDELHVYTITELLQARSARAPIPDSLKKRMIRYPLPTLAVRPTIAVRPGWNPGGPASNANPRGPASNANPRGPASNANPDSPASNATPGSPASNANPGSPASNANPGSPASNANPCSPASNANPGSPASNANPGSPLSNANPGSPLSNANPGSPASVSSLASGGSI